MFVLRTLSFSKIWSDVLCSGVFSEGSNLYRDVISILGPAIQEGRLSHHNQCITGEWESVSVMEVHTYIIYTYWCWYIILNSAHSHTYGAVLGGKPACHPGCTLHSPAVVYCSLYFVISGGAKGKYRVQRKVHSDCTLLCILVYTVVRLGLQCVV